MFHLVITSLTVFVDVKPFVLDTGINAQSVYLFNTIEQHDTTDGSPEVDNQNAKALRTEKSPSVTIESTAISCQQSGHHCS